MSVVLKQIFISCLMAILLASGILVVTLMAFPLAHWQLIYQKQIHGFSFILLLLIGLLLFGLIWGIVSGIYKLASRHSLKRTLDNMIKGESVESLKDDRELADQLNRLQNKLNTLTAQTQHAATERAAEREKSLQEVVIQERNRLARELHDSVSQQLFAASMMMSAIMESSEIKDAADIGRQLGIVERMIHQSQLEMRALLLHLRPVALKGKALYEGMNELLSELIEKVPMTIETKIEPLKLEKGIEDQLFRIFQEAISNTLRHAKADRMTILLIERDEWIILRVWDNGQGFDVDEAKTSSYGLQNMHERAMEIGGALKIVSLPESGTKLEVKVPRIKEEDS